MTLQPGAPVHPADAIAAEGAPLHLSDGRTVQLRYTMGSLRLLEARFGSLQGMQQKLNRGSNGRPCPEHAEPLNELDPHLRERKRTPGHGQALEGCEACEPASGLFTALTDAMAPALLHERVTHPDTGQTVRLGKDPELLAEMVTDGLPEMMKAWAAAFGEAMAQLGGGQGNGAAAGPAANSPGPSGTTPPPSYSDAQMNGSGG